MGISGLVAVRPAARGAAQLGQASVSLSLCHFGPSPGGLSCRPACASLRHDGVRPPDAYVAAQGCKPLPRRAGPSGALPRLQGRRPRSTLQVLQEVPWDGHGVAVVSEEHRLCHTTWLWRQGRPRRLGRGKCKEVH